MTRIARDKQADAQRIYQLLVRQGAYSPACALTDREIAQAVGCAQRDVIELVELLLERDIAIVASCGGSRAGSGGKGRYIECDTAKIESYAKGLQKRAVLIFLRARRFRQVARRMIARRSVEPNGQRRLFAS